MANPEHSPASRGLFTTKVDFDITGTDFECMPEAGSFHTGASDASGIGSFAGLQAGHVLGGRFEIRRQIGIGGMGAVYQAYDRNRRDDIAIKVMLPGLTSSDAAKQRFINEAMVSIKLAHQNIVNTYDVLSEGSNLYITMELLEGRSLRQDIEARKRTNRPYTEAEALKIAHALCDALEYAHDFTIHRDIKPENIWLTRNDKVKLMDFGIARMLNGSQVHQSTSVLGTAYYMAPEQLNGSRNVDSRSDQYALGVMLYELLTGQVPTGRSKSVRQQRTDVSAAVSDAIDRALEPDPQDRYSDMRSFADALDGAKQSAGQTNKTKQIRQTNNTESTGLVNWINQHRMIVSVAGVLWGAVLIGAYFVYQDSQKQVQLAWEKWQSEMRTAYDQTESLKDAPDARVKAWKQYLASYAKDNPFSTADEKLRAQAETNIQEAEVEMKEAKNNAKARAQAQAHAQAQNQVAQQQMRAQQQLIQAQRDKATADFGFALINRFAR